MPDAPAPSLAHRAPSTDGTACGKVILLGEHAVVYGRSALAATIDRHVGVQVSAACGAARFVNVSDTSLDGTRLGQALEQAAGLLSIPAHGFTVAIQSDLPIAVGLGSSAAFSVALLRALATFGDRPLDDGILCAAAFQLERIFHGTPSGIDNTTATYEGLLVFRHGKVVRRLTPPCAIPLVIVLSRSARDTRKMVTDLRHRWEAHPTRYESLFDEVDHLVHDAEGAIGRADLTSLGELMDANHEALRRFGVSTEELDQIVEVARTHGALGAKLTGAGGGGAAICLCPDRQETLTNDFARRGWTAFPATIERKELRSDAAADTDATYQPNNC